jgi:hypothetical protein
VAVTKGWEENYDYVCFASEGLVPIRKNSVWGFADEEGNIVIPAIYQMVWAFKTGLAPVKKNGLWGFIDKTGNVIIDFQYDFVHPFGKEFFRAKKGGEVIIVRISDWIKTKFIFFPEDIKIPVGNENFFVIAVE